MIKNIFITGKPRSGKSMMLERIIGDLPKKTGFITREIKTTQGRAGFELENQKGTRVIFAHVDFGGSCKVGKYGVDIKALELILLESSDYSEDDVLYVDEIGQMQLLSEDFRQVVLNFTNSQNIFLATLSQVFQDDLINDLKNRNDSLTLDLSESNMADQEGFVKAMIHKIRKARKYIAKPQLFTFENNTAILRSEHGARNLSFLEGVWSCDCDFFRVNKICSHSMATSELSARIIPAK